MTLPKTWDHMLRLSKRDPIFILDHGNEVEDHVTTYIPLKMTSTRDMSVDLAFDDGMISRILPANTSFLRVFKA